MDEVYDVEARNTPHEIWVACNPNTLDGWKTLCALVAGYKGVTLTWVDELHVVAVLKPGGALELAR